MLYQPGSTSTGSLKLTVTLASYGIVVSSGPGSVPATHGPSSITGSVRLGLGAPVMKSDPFWSVSCAPLFFLKIDVVLLGASVLALPSWQVALVPYPTK